MVFRFTACSLMLLALPGAAMAEPELAGQAQQVLKAHCGRCHARDGKAKGGFDFVLDRDTLVARKKIVPGQPDASELFQKARSGEMPPKDAKPRPAPEDLAVLEKWIAAGAPGWAPVVKTPPLTEDEVYRRIAADQRALHHGDQKYARYFTLAHLPAGGWAEDEIEACRLGLAKLLNSLSWHPRIAPPLAVDDGRTIFRIDLRDLKWSDRLWDRLTVFSPYPTFQSGETTQVLRADWFIATASRAPLYYELLQVPSADRALERLLQVDAASNIADGSARRTGFTDSGVSKNNRVLERHDSSTGAYWRSYDFSASSERQNILKHPLGPPPARESFIQAGGEMIFHLPNGLFGFFVTDGAGKRVEHAPIEIVSDPQRPDKIVEAGVSCFSCHGKGYLPKADQVRAHVLKNFQAFAKEDVETVQSLYRADAELKKLLDEDNRRYHAALGKLGINPEDTDPITRVTLRYEGPVDLKIAAAEVGLRPAEFTLRLQRSDVLRRQLGALLTDGGNLQRQTFLGLVRELTEELLKDDVPAGARKRDFRPFAGHAKEIGSIAFSPDGSRAVTAGLDRTVRVWDVASGKELRRFDGFRAEVTAAMFTADGKQVVSGCNDLTVRLLDLETGRGVRIFTAPPRIQAVAAFPDGKRIAAADEGSVRVWDVATGEELVSWGIPGAAVHAFAIAPDGKQLATAGGSQVVRLWDTATGKEIRGLTGHTSEVYGVAFSPDGKRLVSGGNDKSVRIWDAVSGKELLCLKGHDNAVIAVAFSADGRQVLSGSSRYRQADQTLRVWDAETGRELRSFDGAGGDVRKVAFAPDGRAALTAGLDPLVRLHKLSD